jgi:hypothetical protein
MAGSKGWVWPVTGSVSQRPQPEWPTVLALGRTPARVWTLVASRLVGGVHWASGVTI